MRVSPQIRELSASVSLNHRQFLQPVFVDESLHGPRDLPNLNGVQAHTPDSLLRTVEDSVRQGISKFLLFPVPSAKQDIPTDFSFSLAVLDQLRRNFGDEIWLVADCCLCAYTANGHCGLTDATGGRIDNDRSVSLLTDYGLAMAQAGAHCIAPSDMMDGRIASIRKGLDENGLDQVSIMSYSAKFSSQWYGPFRDACHSSPASGLLRDRKTYQLSPANPEDAILSSVRDAEEGADMLMVKPAGWYGDILLRIREQVSVPVAAYHVSGEYAALELMAQAGLVDRAAAHLELWTALRRAGADIIISYAAREAKAWIEQQRH
jgi:porphobilinogen synthase